MKKLESRIRTHVRTAGSSLQRILSTNLARKRVEGERHAKQLAENKRRAEAYAQEYKSLVRKAAQGARKLVLLHKSKEVREVLRIIQQIHGSKAEFPLHKGDTDLGGDFLAWTEGLCDISMTPDHVILRITGQIIGEVYDECCCLNAPGGEEEPMTLEQQIKYFCQVLHMEDEKAVEAVKAIDLFKKPENDNHHFLSWFAFLVTCSDEEKLAKLMGKAFKALGSGK